MRRGSLLLVMEPFANDWDLQAVVRSCTFAHADQEPHAAARHQEPAAPAPALALAPRAEALPERAPARTAPVASRASSAAAPVTRKEASSRPLYGALEYLDLDHKPFLLPPGAAPSRAAGDDGREVMISFPAASTSGAPSRAVPPGRKGGARATKPKRSKKSQLKKVVREMPAADGGASSSDPWAWRKYGQKPIKGSPYPRGYYKCSSMKGCMARKLVERSPAKPGVLIVTYMAEHCHPVPTQLNALAGTTRHSKPSVSGAAGEDRPASSPKSHEQHGTVGADEAAARCDADSNEASTTTAPVAAECGGGVEEAAAAVLADDEGEFWPAGMDLDELLAPVDDDFDFEHVLDDDDGVLGRRLSL